jgi:hypothetical protein
MSRQDFGYAIIDGENKPHFIRPTLKKRVLNDGKTYEIKYQYRDYFALLYEKKYNWLFGSGDWY